MQQSQVEIEHYLIAYFEHFTAFEALQCITFITSLHKEMIYTLQFGQHRNCPYSALSSLKVKLNNPASKTLGKTLGSASGLNCVHSINQVNVEQHVERERAVTNCQIAKVYQWSKCQVTAHWLSHVAINKVCQSTVCKMKLHVTNAQIACHRVVSYNAWRQLSNPSSISGYNCRLSLNTGWLVMDCYWLDCYAQSLPEPSQRKSQWESPRNSHKAESLPPSTFTQLSLAFGQVYSCSCCLLQCCYQHNCHSLYNIQQDVPAVFSSFKSQLPKSREIMKLYENVTFDLHAARGYHVKLQLKDIRNNIRQIYLRIYAYSPNLFASVGWHFLCAQIITLYYISLYPSIFSMHNNYICYLKF